MHRSFNKSRIITALDIGTSKICCIIAGVSKEGDIEILGYGYQASNGIKNGVITNINLATVAISKAVDNAEKMANIRITNVIVNISGDKTKFAIRSSSHNINKNRSVNADDIKKVTDKGLNKVDVEGSEPIHFLTMGYHVDDGEEVEDPINIYGDNLSVNIMLGLYPKQMYKNLQTVVESSHLEITQKAFSAYASGLACLVEDEKRLGATVVDIGGGTTSIVSFKNGHPVYFSTIPVGGVNITNDIALGLTTSFAYAEELKNRHGCAFLISKDESETINVRLRKKNLNKIKSTYPSNINEHEAINVYPVGEEDDSSIKQIFRSDLIEIISPRVEEMFEIISRKLDEAGYKDLMSHRVVLTGGTAQMQGIREVGHLILDKQVRIGKPRNIANIPVALHSSIFSTALGLILFAINNSEKKILKKVNVSPKGDKLIPRIIELFKKTC